MTELKPCPFCGKIPDIDDPDTLYPSGIMWVDVIDDGRTYFSRTHATSALAVEKLGHVWDIHCVTTSLGCGAEISGDSVAEVIEKWNRREPSP